MGSRMGLHLRGVPAMLALPSTLPLFVMKRLTFLALLLASPLFGGCTDSLTGADGERADQPAVSNTLVDVETYSATFSGFDMDAMLGYDFFTDGGQTYYYPSGSVSMQYVGGSGQTYLGPHRVKMVLKVNNVAVGFDVNGSCVYELTHTVNSSTQTANELGYAYPPCGVNLQPGDDVRGIYTFQSNINGRMVVNNVQELKYTF